MSVLFLSENSAENQANQWTAVEHLIENCHWEVHSPGLYPSTKPGIKGRLFEYKINGEEVSIII